MKTKSTFVEIGDTIKRILFLLPILNDDAREYGSKLLFVEADIVGQLDIYIVELLRVGGTEIQILENLQWLENKIVDDDIQALRRLMDIAETVGNITESGKSHTNVMTMARTFLHEYELNQPKSKLLALVFYSALYSYHERKPTEA